MDQKTINKIIALNKYFYSKVAKEFSSTRQHPWIGWIKLINIIKNHFIYDRSFSILDIACSNGRFYGFIKNNLLNYEFDYLGIDNNDQLLKEAQKKYGKDFFKKKDIFNLSSTLNKKFDVVIAFGITHHIPSKKLRNKWFLETVELVKNDGLFVINLWNFKKTIGFKKAKRSINTKKFRIKSEELEIGDYFLLWGGKKNVYRYCHYYSLKEVNEISELLKHQKLRLIHRFSDNGKSEKLNLYLVYGKSDI